MILTKVQLKRKLKAIIAKPRRIGLKNRTFSILSNNCWGGMVYDEYAIPYRTPTIGLWIPAHDYIKFLQNIDFYLKYDLKKINFQESNVAELLVERKMKGEYTKPLEDFIIGRCYDVDIVFLHYNSFGEAREKWNRRKKRINWDNLIVKFNDQNGFEISDYEAFIRLPFQNKIFFTANAALKEKANVVFLDKYVEVGYAVDDTKLELMPFDLKEFLNSKVH